MAAEITRASTIGELRAAGWESRSVRTEIRDNVLARISAEEPIVASVLGYEDTIVTQIANALIAGHNLIFLGERGQAKSRIIRSLVELLDEWTPIIAGSEVNDDPYHPVSAYARGLVAELGEQTKIAWISRNDRYGEKLATPDTSIADLIGEVDPIKIAEGRYLSDELTIHYGLVPRTNRGIFAINELPDLSERIQVGLLNILEERDVQIRGHRVRLPVDVLLVASANPDDYTNRGRIITPLKDRFGAQIRTHYPTEVATEVAIILAEAEIPEINGTEVRVPRFLLETIARLSQFARQSQRINQRSGVSLRASISNYETLVAASIARAVRQRDVIATPRPSDLVSMLPSMIGKVEIEALEHDDDEEIVLALVHTALLATFKESMPIERLGEVIGEFEDGLAVEVGAALPASHYEDLLDQHPLLNEIVAPLSGTSAPERASALEFLLEGLYLSRRLSKELVEGVVSYQSRS